MTSTKSRTTALLLCWLLGLFGAHRFYTGKKGSAIAMLIITLTFFGMAITSVWLLVDLIVIACGSFKDSEGATLTNW